MTKKNIVHLRSSLIFWPRMLNLSSYQQATLLPLGMTFTVPYFEKIFTKILVLFVYIIRIYYIVFVYTVLKYVAVNKV